MSYKSINIAFAADENYIQPMSVVIASILKNANSDDNLKFYILCNDVSDSSKKKLMNLKKIKDCDISFFDIDSSEFQSFNIMPGSHITLTAYFRMKLPTILSDIEKILYLDCDLVVKTSLSKLFYIDISDYYIAAVEDIGCTYCRKYRKDILPYDYLYINSGVLLINLAEWRKYNVHKMLLETAKSGINHFQHDQEIINIVCHDKCLSLDLAWNVQDSFFRDDLIVQTNPNAEYIKECAKKPKIIHYTYLFKPWADVKMPMAKEWWYYNKFTPEPMKMNIVQKIDFFCPFLWNIFSVKKINNKIIIRILGIKISFSCKKH